MGYISGMALEPGDGAPTWPHEASAQNTVRALPEWYLIFLAINL